LSAFACAKALAELLKARAEGPKRAERRRSRRADMLRAVRKALGLPHRSQVTSLRLKTKAGSKTNAAA
jgi:hypothetical protein